MRMRKAKHKKPEWKKKNNRKYVECFKGGKWKSFYTYYEFFRRGLRLFFNCGWKNVGGCGANGFQRNEINSKNDDALFWFLLVGPALWIWFESSVFARSKILQDKWLYFFFLLLFFGLSCCCSFSFCCFFFCSLFVVPLSDDAPICMTIRFTDTVCMVADDYLFVSLKRLLFLFLISQELDFRLRI